MMPIQGVVSILIRTGDDETAGERVLFMLLKIRTGILSG
jgi:hypothetical protein